MIQQGVWFLFSLRRMRWASAHGNNSVSSNGNGGDKEIREWLCGIMALCLALPLVLLVAHLVFTSTLSPAPPPPDEHEVMCRYGGVYNDTVREHHIANHYHGASITNSIDSGDDIASDKVINVDVTYLRYRVDCTTAKRYRHNSDDNDQDDKNKITRIYTLGAFGTTDHDIAALFNATRDAELLYPVGAPPFRRWHYDSTIRETPDVMGWAVWLARWLYYVVLLSVLAPLSYLATCTLTLYCPLPRPLLVLAIRVRLWLTTTHQSCV